MKTNTIASIIVLVLSVVSIIIRKYMLSFKVRRLDDAGYKVNTIYGCTTNETDCDNEEIMHRWVELTIYIEATNGGIIHPVEYNQMYRPITRNFVSKDSFRR